MDALPPKNLPAQVIDALVPVLRALRGDFVQQLAALSATAEQRDAAAFAEIADLRASLSERGDVGMRLLELRTLAEEHASFSELAIEELRATPPTLPIAEAYTPGRSYRAGDVAILNGGLWQALRDTAAVPDGHGDWSLVADGLREVAAALDPVNPRLLYLTFFLTSGQAYEVPLNVPIVAQRGEPGEHGRDGQAGAAGPAGAPGRGILGVEQISPGTVQFAFDDDTVSEPIVVNSFRYLGSFQPGKTYASGDVVRLGYSLWIAVQGGGSVPAYNNPAWTLFLPGVEPMGGGGGGGPGTGGGITEADADLKYVFKAGDTMGGFLTLNADPINPLHAATKFYVDFLATTMAQLIGIIDAATGFCVYSTYTGFPNGPLVEASTTSGGAYVICGNPGTVPSGPITGETLAVGDWVISDGTSNWFPLKIAGATLPPGGAQGEVLGKVSGANFDVDWLPPSANVTISDTPPANPAEGDLWFDSVDLNLYIFYVDPTSSQWVVVVNTGGGGGTTPPFDPDPLLPRDGTRPMVGALVLAGAPTLDDHAASKLYVDERTVPPGGALGQVLAKAGPTDFDTAWAVATVVPMFIGHERLTVTGTEAIGARIILPNIPADTLPPRRFSYILQGPGAGQCYLWNEGGTGSPSGAFHFEVMADLNDGAGRIWRVVTAASPPLGGTPFPDASNHLYRYVAPAGAAGTTFLNYDPTGPDSAGVQWSVVFTTAPTLGAFTLEAGMQASIVSFGP